MISAYIQGAVVLNKCTDNAIHLHWINLYPVDCVIGFPYDPYICYDTSLSARKRYQP